jgi:hypothetical protein
VTQGFLDAQTGSDVLRVRQTSRLFDIVLMVVGALFVFAGGVQIWLAFTGVPQAGTSASGARWGAMYGAVFVVVGLFVAVLFRGGIVVRFERSASVVTIVWHRGEQVLREEVVPVVDFLHVSLETDFRKARQINDTYRVVIGTSCKGDIRLADGFGAGHAFFERQREEIRSFLGVAALATHERSEQPLVDV